MKKLLMLLLSTILLLSFATLAAAEVNISGEFSFNWNIKDSNDKADMSMSFETRLTKEYSVSCGFEYETYDYAKEGGPHLTYSGYTVRYRTKTDDLQVGSFGKGIGEYVDELDALFGDFMGEFQIQYEHKWGKSGWSNMIGFIPDRSQSDEEPTGDCAYMLNAKYSRNKWSYAAYYFNSGEDLTINDKNSKTGTSTGRNEGISLSARYDVNKNWRIYHQWQKKILLDQYSSIMGTRYTIGKYWFQIEHDFMDDFGKATTDTVHRTAYKAHYQLMKDYGMEMIYTEKADADGGDDWSFSFGIKFR
jgi:hypothetical protein